jgi:hypothetical protein
VSPLDGHTHEMPSPTLDDRALDALRSGTRSVPAGFDWLVPFVEELGEASSQPAPVVRPALALLLAEGFSPAPAPAPAPTPAAAPAPAWTAPVRPARRSGLGARVAAGFGLALAGATAAGAAGVLPDPAQHAMATVVEVATPFTFPDTADEKADFGAKVSRDATGASDGQPGVDGRAVSDAARDKAPAPGPAGDGVGPNTGATGLDRANQTPAAGHPPTSVASGNGAGGPPASPGSQASNGLGTAGSTPAAGQVPSSVPAVTRPGPPGQGGGAATVDDPPAVSRAPVSAPARK